MKKGNRQDRNKLRRTLIRFAVPVWLLLYAFTTRLHAQTNTAQFAGVTYTNYHTKEPWSVHVVRIERSLPGLALLSPHANGAALGLTTLSQQLAQLHSSFGVPLAAI